MPKTTPTHKKCNNSEDSNQFSPITSRQSPGLFSSQRQLTGPPRVLRDLCADLYNNIQKWNDVHISGAQIIKKIASISAEDPNNTEIESFVNNLYEIVENLTKYYENFDIYVKQMSALEKITHSEPIFISMNIKTISNLFSNIKNAYKKEFNVKKQVLENIMYIKNANNLMFLASCWTYQCYITDLINFNVECLLIEAGHRKIN